MANKMQNKKLKCWKKRGKNIWKKENGDMIVVSDRPYLIGRQYELYGLIGKNKSMVSAKTLDQSRSKKELIDTAHKFMKKHDKC